MTVYNPSRDSELEAIFRRWIAFGQRLKHEDRRLLDMLAMGMPLKTAAYAIDISYATAHKRLSRWQEKLGVRNLNQLVEIWIRLSGEHEHAENQPTIMRRLDDLAKQVLISPQLRVARGGDDSRNAGTVR